MRNVRVPRLLFVDDDFHDTRQSPAPDHARHPGKNSVSAPWWADSLLVDYVGVTNTADAIKALMVGGFTHVSLDHDYGETNLNCWSWITQTEIYGNTKNLTAEHLPTCQSDAGNGTYLTKWILAAARCDVIPPIMGFYLHSQNPIGKDAMHENMTDAQVRWSTPHQ